VPGWRNWQTQRTQNLNFEFSVLVAKIRTYRLVACSAWVVLSPVFEARQP
jgi:hypothetical protein